MCTTLAQRSNANYENAAEFNARKVNDYQFYAQAVRTFAALAKVLF